MCNCSVQMSIILFLFWNQVQQDNRLYKMVSLQEEHKNDAGFSNLNVYEYTNSGEEGDYTEDGIYAIEISDMSFFDGMNIEKKYPDERQTMYLALARTSKRPDIAKAFAAEIISTNK